MAFVLTGCNTVKGVGKDVSKAGEAVTGTAEKLLKKSVETKLFLASPQTLSQIGFLCEHSHYRPYSPIIEPTNLSTYEFTI